MTPKILTACFAGLALAALSTFLLYPSEDAFSHSVGIVIPPKWEVLVIDRLREDPFDSFTGCEAYRKFPDHELKDQARKENRAEPHTICREVR